LGRVYASKTVPDTAKTVYPKCSQYLSWSNPICAQRRLGILAFLWILQAKGEREPQIYHATIRFGKTKAKEVCDSDRGRTPPTKDTDGSGAGYCQCPGRTNLRDISISLPASEYRFSHYFVRSGPKACLHRWHQGGKMVDMKLRHLALSLVVLVWAGTARAQSSAVTVPEGVNKPQAGAPLKQDPTPDQIIRAFSAKESEFYEAWMQYAYHQSANVRVLSVNGIPKREEMETISNIVFKDDGTRDILVVRRSGGLKSVVYTIQDEEVINNLQPFALTEKELPNYDLTYQGKEKVDELTCYVFGVRPKNIKSGKMYFEGRIWIDDEDLQVVRTMGKPVPQKKDNQFPEFETIRQRIDNKYWFPVWTHAESKLQFQSDTIHIDETITYGEYKRFATNTSIQYGTKKH
jgi:hypothetical protein